MKSRFQTVMAAVAVALAANLASAGTADDSALTAKVKTALVANPGTEATKIDVESNSGVVQLNGFVDTKAARAEAERVAAHVDGVARVQNNLSVRGVDRPAGTVVDDAMITAKVKAAVVEDPLTKAGEINVETHDGTVQLSGFVGNDAEKKRAADLAQSVEGVRLVQNKLAIKTY